MTTKEVVRRWFVGQATILVWAIGTFVWVFRYGRHMTEEEVNKVMTRREKWLQDEIARILPE